MRRFLVPIIIFAFTSWITLFVLLNFTSPFISPINYNELLPITINYQKVALFLTSLFLAITFTFALAFYFFYRFIGDYVDARQTLRRSLRQSFFVSAGLITLAILQLTKTLNPLTFILTIAVVIALEFTFRATK